MNVMQLPISTLFLEVLEKERQQKLLALRYCQHSKKQDQLIKRILRIEHRMSLWHQKQRKKNSISHPHDLHIA